MTEPIEIIPVQSPRELKQFARLPFELYRNDPHFIRPLLQERLELIHPKKNPYYQHATVRLFLARKNGRNVGRISAQIDQEYEKIYGYRVGHFGFFESENDPAIAHALFERAESFFREHKARRAQGPFSFSINEESGLLIEGFHEPLMTMMPYNPSYYLFLIEGEGYRKAKDLYAWKYQIGEIPLEALEVAEVVSQYPGLVIRNLDEKRFREDLGKIIEIFNSAWSENWGFVPFVPAEIDKAAKDLKMFADPQDVFIAEIDGLPVAMAAAIPNLYEMIQDLNGKLFPFGIFKLLYRIKKKKYRSGRLMLLGIRKEYREGILGGLSILLYSKMHEQARKKGIQWGELSWTLEDNLKVNRGIEFMGGKRYKTYRVYEKEL